jgi:hypothetical protein
MARDRYFPGRGDDGFVILENVSIAQNLRPLESLITSLESSSSIFEVDDWYSGFKKYTNMHFKEGMSIYIRKLCNLLASIKSISSKTTTNFF